MSSDYIPFYPSNLIVLGIAVQVSVIPVVTVSSVWDLRDEGFDGLRDVMADGLDYTTKKAELLWPDGSCTTLIAVETTLRGEPGVILFANVGGAYIGFEVAIPESNGKSVDANWMHRFWRFDGGELREDGDKSPSVTYAEFFESVMAHVFMKSVQAHGDR